MKKLSISFLIVFFIIGNLFSNTEPINPMTNSHKVAFPKSKTSTFAFEENVVLGGNNDGSILDIMILYTPAASQDLGGQSKTEKWIKEAVLSANIALRNSQVKLRFDLCHKGQISYNESTNSVDLKNLTNGINGLENVEYLRSQYHADVVVLITFNNQGGQAQALMSLNGDHAKSRFGVIKAGSTSTFIHEVGHILGAQHDGMNDKGQEEIGIFPYAHGYTGNNLGGSSIVGGFVKNNKSSGKINFYSNPNLSYRNQPLGTANFSDNHRTFNETAAAIDQLFNSEIRWTGDGDSDWNNPVNWSTTTVPRSIDDVVIAESSYNAPSIQSGVATCRNLLLENGTTLNMSGGQLNIRGHLNVKGNFLGTGGTVDMRNDLDNGAVINLSNSSYLHHLIIGGEDTRSWIQLANRLLVKGDLTIKPWAILDHSNQTIVIDGNWIDEGGAGFNYQYSEVKIGGTSSVSNTTFNFLIPPDSNGGNSYGSAASGWGEGTEGNFAMKWMFGGPQGAAWLKGTFASNDPVGYVIDSWIFTPPIALCSGTTYKIEFEANSSKKGQGMQRADNGKFELHDLSVHYGKGQLPNLMDNSVGTAQQVTSDNVWIKVENEFSVNANGKFELGLRTFNDQDAWGADTYIKNIKITPTSEKPENFGNANIEVVITEPTTTSPGTTTNTTDTSTPTGLVVNPATTTGTTTTPDPSTTTGIETNTGTSAGTSTNTTTIVYPITVATGEVYHVNNSINWRTYTYNVDLDRIEASAYAPSKDDGKFKAGERYSIFMITHANKSQGFLEYNPIDDNWASEIKKFRAATVTPKSSGPNSFKPKDTFKLIYEPGKLTWEVSRANEIVAVFSANFTAEKVTMGTNTEETSTENPQEEEPSTANQGEEGTSNPSNTNQETTPAVDPEILINSVKSGQELIMNGKIYSANGDYYLILESDGNAIIYNKNNQVIWKTQTGGNGAHCRFVMQDDGHLVLYSPSDSTLWVSETHTYWNPKYASEIWKPVKMVLENDGSLVLYSATDNKVWTSKLGKLPNSN